jgi:hypothetical protein
VIIITVAALAGDFHHGSGFGGVTNFDHQRPGMSLENPTRRLNPAETVGEATC